MLAQNVLENIDLILSWLEKFAYIDGSSVLFDELEHVFHAQGKVQKGFIGDDHVTIECGGQPEMVGVDGHTSKQDELTVGESKVAAWAI